MQVSSRVGPSILKRKRSKTHFARRAPSRPIIENPISRKSIVIHELIISLLGYNMLMNKYAACRMIRT